MSEKALKGLLLKHDWAQMCWEHKKTWYVSIYSDNWFGLISHSTLRSSQYEAFMSHRIYLNMPERIEKSITFFHVDLSVVVKEIERIVATEEPNKERLKINL